MSLTHAIALFIGAWVLIGILVYLTWKDGAE